MILLSLVCQIVMRPPTMAHQVGVGACRYRVLRGNHVRTDSDPISGSLVALYKSLDSASDILIASFHSHPAIKHTSPLGPPAPP